MAADTQMAKKDVIFVMNTSSGMASFVHVAAVSLDQAQKVETFEKKP